jgi:hypothetical protein
VVRLPRRAAIGLISFAAAAVLEEGRRAKLVEKRRGTASGSRSGEGRSAEPLARNGGSAVSRFPFRNRTISGLEHSHPPLPLPLPLLGRQAWPEVGRPPECRNIKQRPKRIAWGVDAAKHCAHLPEAWAHSNCNGEGKPDRHLVLLSGLICAARQPGKSRDAATAHGAPRPLRSGCYRLPC